jgi:glycosyltransferase involved in cell wall biosynthesis
MNIGLVWPATHRLVDITVRYERYVRGFEALGHRVVTVCPAGTEDGYPFPVHTVPDVEALRRPELWRELRLDAAVIIAWLRMPEIMAAMKSACPYVVSIGESDGVVGVRVWPLTILRRMVAFHTRLGMKVRALKHWVLLALGGYREAERPVIESAAAADLITLTSPAARANLAAVLAHHRRPQLADKLAVAPYPVDDLYRTGDVLPAEERENRVVAIGRWDDPQKDAALLADGIEFAAARMPDAEFVLVGRNGETPFYRLCRRFPRVRYLGVQSPGEIAGLLARSRALVLSSRWESGPIVAFEALSMGAAVIGPRWVPACEWFCGTGPFGSLYERRSASALGYAIVEELTAWRDGERDPRRIADLWRPRFDPVTVCRVLLSGMKKEDRCSAP